jgi:hypothetical protein
MRAAGIPPIITVAEPTTMASAPQLSPMRAAGIPPMSTVGAPGGIMGVGTPKVAVLTIMSVTRAAGGMASPLGSLRRFPYPIGGTGVTHQLICTIPPLITVVALPFIVVVLELDISALLVPDALKAL